MHYNMASHKSHKPTLFLRIDRRINYKETKRMNIDQTRFEDWLFSQSRRRVIEAGHSKTCFLFSFLRETKSVSNPTVYLSKWQPEHDGEHLPLPDWLLELLNLSAMERLSKGKYFWPIACGQMQDRYRLLFPAAETLIVPSEGRFNEANTDTSLNKVPQPVVIER